MESDEFIKSSVENLVPNPSESKGEHECDVPACNDFTTFSNLLFDVDDDFSSSDDESFSDEDISKKIYSEIISMKIDPHYFNADSDLIESLLNQGSSIISSSSKIDSLLNEFAGELTLLKLIPPGINETDYDPEEETCLIKKLLDILILKELLSNDSLSLLENESFHFDIPSSSRPSAKPPDGNLGILNVKVMGDISKHNVHMPRLMLTQPTLVPNQEKSPNLLSHQGHKACQPSTECPMMIYGRNTPILDIFPDLKTHAKGFYPPVFTSSASFGNHEVGILQDDAQSIPITTEPSTSKSQKKHKPTRKHTQESEVPPIESLAKQNLPSPSNDPLPSERIEKLEGMVERLEEENRVLKELKSVHSTNDADEPVMAKEKSSKQGSVMDVNEEEPANVEEVLEVVKPAKLMTEVVTTARGTKRKPLTQAQARRNMIVYLKNMIGFKMDYFKGMTYDEIKPLFEKHYNYNQDFLDEVNEGVKVLETEVRQEKDVEVEISKREGESLEQEIAKKQKIKEETEELKKHLKIVTDDDDDDDDDVYTDATPLASKIPIVDYKIYTKRNRPYFKIIRADRNHMMYPLTHFTLEQMLNDVRLQVEDESEMSLKLLRLVRRQLNEG
nr:hypothetical protein [Tanacetum cinerariifolium]